MRSILEDTRVPKENILGKPGDGAKIVFGSLNQTRLSAAAGGVGLAQACLDAATKYCNEREQFGKPIGQFQMNQDMIAQMAVEIEAARLMVYKAAWQKDQGNLNNTLEVAMAKYLAGEVANKASNYAMRILGAYGYSTEYPGGPVLPGRPDLFHGGRLGQYLQVDHRPWISWGSGKRINKQADTGSRHQLSDEGQENARSVDRYAMELDILTDLRRNVTCNLILKKWTIWANL